MTRPSTTIPIYHIVHMDRLGSIMEHDCLWADTEVRGRNCEGTTIGMTNIKERRRSTHLASHPSLTVGACVPFYFCPRSVMLYLLHKGNHPGVTYRGGQEPIVHLVANMPEAVQWAEANDLKWAFTLSNGGSRYFEDRSDMADLHEIDWKAVKARMWKDEFKEAKQAEFLVERRFPWNLTRCIGVRSETTGRMVTGILTGHSHKPVVKVKPDWYY